MAESAYNKKRVVLESTTRFFTAYTYTAYTYTAYTYTAHFDTALRC